VPKSSKKISMLNLLMMVSQKEEKAAKHKHSWLIDNNISITDKKQ
jgi:hypothetical protein